MEQPGGAVFPAMRASLPDNHRITLVALAIAPALLASCGSSDLAERVAGTWPRTEEGQLLDRYSFDGDGIFRFDEDAWSEDDVEDHLWGSYETEDAIMTLLSPI